MIKIENDDQVGWPWTTITTTVRTREEMDMDTLKRIPYKTIEKYLRKEKLKKINNI